jgi:methionyl-tRNA formyltransferase
VLTLTAERGWPLFTPANKHELSDLFAAHTFSSTCGVVVDYGIIISKEVINCFPKGIVNGHFSLLPQWRGADPITFAILSGQAITGVSLMLIVPALDEGPLLATQSYEIPQGTTTPQLTNALVDISNQLLVITLPAYLDGRIQPRSQDINTLPTYSRKLVKEDGILDPSKPAEQLERDVRAFTGWPKSRLTLHGHQVIVTKARVAQDKNDGALVVACQPGWLEIQELTAPSGKKMTGADFLRGYAR